MGTRHHALRCSQDGAFGHCRLECPPTGSSSVARSPRWCALVWVARWHQWNAGCRDTHAFLCLLTNTKLTHLALFAPIFSRGSTLGFCHPSVFHWWTATRNTSIWWHSSRPLTETIDTSLVLEPLPQHISSHQLVFSWVVFILYTSFGSTCSAML